MIEVYDNVLTKKQSDDLLSLCTNPYLAWYLFKEDIQYSKPYKQYSHYQMVHNLFNKMDSDQPLSIHYNFIYPLIQTFITKFKLTGEIYRVKLNLLHNHYLSDTGTNPVHADHKEKHISLLYYINDSDGDTVFYKKYKEFHRVQPKKNRLVIAKGPIHHASNHPKNTENRFVLNTVLLTK